MRCLENGLTGRRDVTFTFRTTHPGTPLDPRRVWCRSEYGGGYFAARRKCKSQSSSKAILRAQNHRGKIPGAGRRVQCEAGPDEASNTLTRRPATHHHASDSRARPHATVDWLRIIRARCRCLFMDCLSPCQIADMACSWTRLFTRTARGQSASVAAVTDCRNCGLCVDTDNPCSRLVHDESTVADCPCPCPRLWKMARLLARILRALQVLMKISRGKAYGRLSSFQAG